MQCTQRARFVRTLYCAACCLMVLSVGGASDHARCLVEQPAVNRSHVELRVAHFDWLTHELVTTLAEIICQEVLGYTFVRVYPSSSQTWGEDMTSGLYDLDVEQWHVDPIGEEYSDYVLTRSTVLDAGHIGYSGRSGLYTYRSMLEKDAFVDYYKFYKNSSAAMELGFRSFRDSDLQSFLAESFPACEVDWCGTGDLIGYWAPPACRAVPDVCIEILKASPTHDEGYFEQLVKNHGLRTIFGYYGEGLEEHLRSLDNRGVLFFWWEPTLLHAQLDIVRISFPDHYVGCDSVYAVDPDVGGVSCDAAELPLRKITSRRLRDSAPQAYLALSLLTLDQNTIKDMLLFHDNSSGNGQTFDETVFDTACAYAQVLSGVLPTCLTNPKTVQVPFVTLVETFNPETLRCENISVLEEAPATTCNTTPPALVDRSEHEIRIAVQPSLSQNLASTVTEIILREHLGYKVVSVFYLNSVSALDLRADLISGLIDVEMENWYPELMTQYYESGQIHFAGPIGYDAREGLYVSEDAVQRNEKADYYKFFQNATRAAQFGFITHSESPLHQFLSEDFLQPCVSGSGNVDWCGSGSLEGYWATPTCADSPGRCIEVAMKYPGWGRTIVEQASANWGLEVVLAYYGPVEEEALSFMHSEPGRFVPFFAWEPDGLLLKYNARRLSFPDLRLGCLDGNTFLPDGDVRCDVPSVHLEKAVSMRVAALPEARYALDAIQFTLAEMNDMIARHLNGGGPLTTSEVACEFVRSQASLVQTWAPDCIVRPPPPENVRVNDTVFSQQEGKCAPITCAPDKILTYSSAFNAFACEECRDGEIPDASQRSCRFCDYGEQPDEAGVGCTACLPGTSALARSGACIACAPGMYSGDGGKSACDVCPMGKYTSMTSGTSCTSCSAGSYADELGSIACKLCAAGYFKDNSSEPHQCFPCQRGTFASDLGSTGCDACSFGTTEILGALSAAFCTCPPSTFLHQTANGERQCLACNSYMQPCQGGEHPAQQLAGYHISADGATVHRCASEEACPRGLLGTCSAGASGPGCAQCEAGKYVWNGDRCTRCGASDSVYAFISPVLLAIGLWMTYRYGNEPTSRKLSTTSEFIILAGLSANIFFYLNSFVGFDVLWKEPVDSLLQLLSSISSELTAVHLSCSMSVSNVINYILSSVVPALIVLIFILLALLQIAAPRKLFNTLASCTYALFLLLLLHALKPFRYIVHPYGGRSMLGLPDVFEGSAEHTGLVFCGICVLIFYCMPFVALCILATFYVSRSRTRAQTRWWLMIFRFLFYKFRPEIFYWGVYILVRNIFFALAPSLAPEIPKIGVFVLTFITSCSMAHTALLHPWRHFWMTIVDVALLAYILLVLNLAAGWAREDESADGYLASSLVSIGGLGCACACIVVLRLLLGHMFASKESLEKMRADSAEQDDLYLKQFFRNPQLEVSDAFEVLALGSRSPASTHAVCHLSRSLTLIQHEETTMSAIAGIARSIRDPEYHLQHFYEDCMHAFPELQLYDGNAMRLKASQNLDGSSSVLGPSNIAVGGHTLADEQQRTMGAFFALYCLCRLDMNGKEVMSFGVDENRPHVVNGVSPGLTQDALKSMAWGKMSPPERRANFYWHFDWQLMETLMLEAGILLHDEEKGLVVDDRPEGRLVAMLSLTACHDIMKDQALCPTVSGSDYEGLKVGESILDHDLALAYLFDRHPEILPSYRILTENQQRLVRFTQADMGFNAGWLVQAEGPPSGVLHKLKKTISRGGVQDRDVAFYFVHWVTDLAGAEPTPFTGSEKFAAKFPPVVLQGLLGCFSIVRMLADHTEIEVYEAYLRQRWQLAQSKDTSLRGLPEGKDGIARMRLLCMAQAGADSVLDAFDQLSEEDRDTLVQELSETGIPGQHFSGCRDGAGAGTPFLLYYGPAWCQRVGQQQPTLALRVLAEVFRRGREEFPESQDSDHDIKAGIMCRTIEVGLLKTADMEKWKEHNGNTDSLEPHGAPMLLVERSSNLEGTLHEAYDM